MIDHEKLLKLMGIQFKIYISTLKLAQDFIKIGLSMTIDRPRETAKELFDTLISLISTSETLDKDSLTGVVKEVYEEVIKK
jgi:hypothetical protein